MSDDDLAFAGPTQEERSQDLRALFLGAIRATLELVLEEEVKRLVGARRYERTAKRVDTHNGSYMRGLLTSMGHIEVAMPRARKGGAPTEVLGAYARRMNELDEAITETYVRGVGTRGMSGVAEALVGNGNGVSRSTVSRVTKRLEAQVEELRARKLAEPIPYLYLDATFLDARWARKVENVSALVAYGVNREGKRELLAVTLGLAESEESWAELLAQLVERGLHGVRLVISDAHAGLWAAVRHHLPEVPHQRCIVHLMRNVGGKVAQRLRERVLGEVSRIFKANDLKQAKARLAEFQARWAKELPEAVECLSKGFPAASQYFAFPKAHWIRLRSTNGLERLHGEIKRRIRAVGAFPDRGSALRLIVAVAQNATSVWSARRYLDMSLLADEA